MYKYYTVNVNPFFLAESVNKATYHSEASRYECVGLHLHGAAGEGAVGGAAAAALAALQPSMAALWQRSGESVFRSVSAPLVTSGSLWSVVGPPGDPLLQKDKLMDNGSSYLQYHREDRELNSDI